MTKSFFGMLLTFVIIASCSTLDTSTRKKIEDGFASDKVRVLVHSIIESDNEGFQKMLDGKQADIQAASVDGLTPLWIAMEFDNYYAFDALLKAGALKGIPPENNVRLIRRCAEYKDIKFLASLKNNGIDLQPKEYKGPDLIEYLNTGDVPLATFGRVLDLGIDLSGKRGFQYVWSATFAAAWEHALLLLQKGVDLNQDERKKKFIYDEINEVRARAGNVPETDRKIEKLVKYLQEHYSDFK